MEDPKEQMREGSQYDRRDLEELFEKLGYTSIVYPKNISDMVTEEVSFSVCYYLWCAQIVLNF